MREGGGEEWLEKKTFIEQITTNHARPCGVGAAIACDFNPSLLSLLIVVTARLLDDVVATHRLVQANGSVRVLPVDVRQISLKSHSFL